METIDLIQNSLDYIEANLKTDITNDELAKHAGFSLFHYCRIFSTYVGYSTSAYVTRRRLYHAVYELQQGRSSLEVAIDYGFDTYAGFYKAFKREFGCSPTKYRKTTNIIRPLHINLRQEAKIMLTHTQITQILTNWNINLQPKVKETELLTADGYSKANRSWYIGDSYILKSGRNINNLKTHIAVAKALSQATMTDAAEGTYADAVQPASISIDAPSATSFNLAMSLPVPTKAGDDFMELDDCYYVLLQRVQGQFLTPEERFIGDRVGIGTKYGEAIGFLHKALKHNDASMEVNNADLYKTCMEWALPETKRLMEQWGCPLPENFYESYSTEFGKLYSKLPKHVIHRDPNPSNILWSNGHVSSFIDFEISERNVRLFDPCYCATGILAEAGSIENGYKKWPELLAGILHGYDSVCKLTDEEKLAIPYVIYSIQMIFIAWLDSQTDDKVLAEINRNMLSWLWNNRENWQQSFNQVL